MDKEIHIEGTVYYYLPSTGAAVENGLGKLIVDSYVEHMHVCKYVCIIFKCRRIEKTLYIMHT